MSKRWTTAATDSLLATNFINKPDVYSTRSHSSNGGHKFQPVGYSSHITTNQLLSLYTLLEKIFFCSDGCGVVVGGDKGKYDALFLISINYQHPSGEAQIKILIWQSNGECVSSLMNQRDLIQSYKTPKPKYPPRIKPIALLHILPLSLEGGHLVWRFNQVAVIKNTNHHIMSS